MSTQNDEPTADHDGPTIWPSASAVVRQRLIELREKHGISAQRLAERCARFGMPGLNRSVLANFETGRRPSITIDEVLVLARALDVAPIYLFIPLEDGHLMAVGEAIVPSGTAREWARGNFPLPSGDIDRYLMERPTTEWDATEALAKRKRTEPPPEVMARRRQLTEQLLRRDVHDEPGEESDRGER